MSRRVVDALKRLRERQRFMKGLFAWVGYRQASVVYANVIRATPARIEWNYWKPWNFALEAFTSFSSAPLKLATYLGFAAAAPGLRCSACGCSPRALLFWRSGTRLPLARGGRAVPRRPSHGLLGVIGERPRPHHVETKQRPLIWSTATSPRDSNARAETHGVCCAGGGWCEGPDAGGEAHALVAIPRCMIPPVSRGAHRLQALRAACGLTAPRQSPEAPHDDSELALRYAWLRATRRRRLDRRRRWDRAPRRRVSAGRREAACRRCGRGAWIRSLSHPGAATRRPAGRTAISGRWAVNTLAA